MNPLLEVPAHVRSRLSKAIEFGLVGAPATPSSIATALGGHEFVQVAVNGLAELEGQGIEGRGVASWLRAVDEAMGRVPRPHLVWSGPEAPGLHARDTRRVYEELLGTAERSAWIGTYAFFDGPRAFEVLARRMDALPGLDVKLLLNVQRKKGDTFRSRAGRASFCGALLGHGLAGAITASGLVRPTSP